MSKISRKEWKELSLRAERLHKDEPGWRRKENVDFFLYLLMVVLVLLSIRVFIGEPIRVDGPSMTPTLLDRERMIVEKVSYLFHTPKRGDIIICYYPGYTDSCVKRIIGLPGENVEVADGVIYIDGAPLDESAYWNDYIETDTWVTQVPDNAVFVVGDNRNHSKDSRHPDVGCIPYEKVTGRAVCVLWPLENIRPIDHEI